MQKSTIILLAILALLVGAGSWFVSTGNQLVTLDEKVNERWSQVENVYQRRADLIPNLVNTVKGYAKHESEVFESVAKARSQAQSIKVESAQDLKKFEEAQQELAKGLGRLMVVAERYPELKASEGFLQLQSQLEGTENRITVERMRFNEAAREWNTSLRVFPSSMVASFKGFQVRAYFESKEGSDQPPEVTF